MVSIKNTDFLTQGGHAISIEDWKDKERLRKLLLEGKIDKVALVAGLRSKAEVEHVAEAVRDEPSLHEPFRNLFETEGFYVPSYLDAPERLSPADYISGNRPLPRSQHRSPDGFVPDRIKAPTTKESRTTIPVPVYEPAEGNPFGDRAWDVYSDAVAQIESGGRYNIQGGYNNHYDGKYQLGRAAKADAARRLGITLGHSADDRKAYLADPELQERAFEAFTLANHDTLSRTSEKYRGMTKQEQLSILAYAHNQGAGGALDYLRTGQAGSDGFGTNAQVYVDAVKKRFGGGQ